MTQQADGERGVMEGVRVDGLVDISPISDSLKLLACGVRDHAPVVGPSFVVIASTVGWGL